MKELLEAWYKFCEQEYFKGICQLKLYAVDCGGYDITSDTTLTLDEQSGIFTLDILGEKFKLALVG